MSYSNIYSNTFFNINKQSAIFLLYVQTCNCRRLPFFLSLLRLMLGSSWSMIYKSWWKSTLYCHYFTRSGIGLNNCFILKVAIRSVACMSLLTWRWWCCLWWSRTGQEGIHLVCVYISLGSAIHGLCWIVFLWESIQWSEWSSSRPIEEVCGPRRQNY